MMPQLVTLALDNNRDLRVALAAIEQARAQYQIRRADQLPTINAAVAGNRQPSSNGESISSSYTAGLAMASWELDFWPGGQSERRRPGPVPGYARGAQCGADQPDCLRRQHLVEPANQQRNAGPGRSARWLRAKTRCA